MEEKFKNTITLSMVKENKILYEKIKNIILENYLESFNTIKEVSEIFNISTQVISYVIKTESWIKDKSKYNAQKDPRKRDMIEQKKRETAIKHFGSIEEAKIYAVQKNKESKVLRHGDPNYNNPQKGIETKIKHFGSIEEASRQALKKYKETCLEKYGVDNIFKRTDIIQAAFEKKYGEGIINCGQVAEVLEKRVKTNREKYGVDCTFQSEEVKNKIKQTNLQKYGCENANQNPEIQQKSRETRISKGIQIIQGNEVENFLNQWDKRRKPTTQDFVNYLKTIGINLLLSNAYGVIINQGKESYFEKKHIGLENIIEDFFN